MVVKVYISGISGNKEVKKRQQRVTMILDSKSIEYDLVDITEPGKEEDKAYMQTNSKTKDGSRNALPPQIFNNNVYCGDYDDFDIANELDELDKFFDISSKKQPSEAKEINGSDKTEEHKEESTNGENKPVEGAVNDSSNEEEDEKSKSDGNDSDEDEKDLKESLDTQVKMNGTTEENTESVPHPDDTKNTVLDIPETKQDKISDNEEEIEE
ncbi:SH3 domain-binding glutamic acid-rich protein homolog [Adelges cooleyi]|uniref:SH3 domain-binding glutamic acid-rich protein homolog n=1 Tax=Adelges cooleyi TaxID=133065 RepID=UPI00217F5871|nr:SH3 domain-binding glutamic acid-rich protein homolog [Adelges cooleyi]